jgi:enamine deaminase RidA (YjgF/YER057c/UK114 family)
MPEFRSPEGLPQPFGYSHVVTVAPGPLVITAGQIGMNAQGEIAEGWEAQTRLAFENVSGALRAGGAGWGDVVKLTYFVTDTTELPTVRAVRDEFVDTENPPASTLVKVAGLFLPGLLIEIEAIASPRGEVLLR